MIKAWTEVAWNDYLYWQQADKKILRRINLLILDIERNGYKGLAKSEPLRGNRSGWWSKRIDDAHRLVFRISGDTIIISGCRTHYGKK